MVGFLRLGHILIQFEPPIRATSLKETKHALYYCLQYVFCLEVSLKGKATGIIIAVIKSTDFDVLVFVRL